MNKCRCIRCNVHPNIFKNTGRTKHRRNVLYFHLLLKNGVANPLLRVFPYCAMGNSLRQITKPSRNAPGRVRVSGMRNRAENEKKTLKEAVNGAVLRGLPGFVCELRRGDTAMNYNHVAAQCIAVSFFLHDLSVFSIAHFVAEGVDRVAQSVGFREVFSGARGSSFVD